MAVYHFNVKTISRSAGQSVVGSAAWRTRENLYDERLGKRHKYAHFKDLADSMILIPEYVPERLKDRETLWNEVEQVEQRKDSQLARVIEMAIPLELNLNQQIDLLREFALTSFVERGMIADIALIAKESNPYATIMLTTRVITKDGWKEKNRDWNRRELVFTWRKEWADIQNRKLKEAGHDVRVDHRSYAERGIDLEPQSKIGVMAKYLPGGNDFLQSTKGYNRLEEYQRIRYENGVRIIEQPLRALKLLKEKNTVFKRRDLERFAKFYSANMDQYQHVFSALERCPALQKIGTDTKGNDIYSIVME